MTRRYRDYNPMDTEEDDYDDYELQDRIHRQYARSNGGGSGLLVFLIIGLIGGVWAFGSSITNSNKSIQVVPNAGYSRGEEYYQRTQGGTVTVDPNASSPPVGWSGSPSVTPQQYGAMGRGGMYQDNVESPCLAARGC